MYIKRFLMGSTFLRAADGDGTGGGGANEDQIRKMSTSEALRAAEAAQRAAGGGDTRDEQTGDQGGDGDGAGQGDDAGEGGDQGEDGDGAGEGDGAAAAASGDAELPSWAEKEMGRKHAQIKERDRKIAEQDQLIRDLQTIAAGGGTGAAGGTDGAAAPKPTVSLTADQIRQEAQRIVAEQNVTNALTEVHTKGQEAYKDKWAASLTRLASFGEVDQADMHAILGTDNPHKVLYELGSNPKEYLRIMELPPAKRHTEFVKIAIREAKPVHSKAPPPVNQQDTRVTPPSGLNDKLSDDEWFKRRRAEKAQKFKEANAR